MRAEGLSMTEDLLTRARRMTDPQLPCTYSTLEWKALVRELVEAQDFSRVNRVEVINHAKDGLGRDYVFFAFPGDVLVEPQLQDNRRTLKVFISNAAPNP